MEFKLTVCWPGDNRGGTVETRDLPGMQEEVAAIGRLLDSMAPGETITIERLS